MYVLPSLRMCFAMFLLVLICLVATPSQRGAVLQDDTTVTIVNDETYEQVLDILFPRPVLDDDSADFAFILRFKPSFSPESQIIIVKRAKNLEIVKLAPVDGSIHKQINGIYQRTKKMDPSEMAKQVQIRRQIVSLSTQEVQSLREGFLTAACAQARMEKRFISKSEDGVSLTTDGTIYQLWYKGMNNLSYNFTSSGYGRPGESAEAPFTKWMKAVDGRVNQSLTSTQSRTETR